MMRIYKSPQRSDEKLTYDFSGDAISVSYTQSNGTTLTEVFDFTGMPNGRAEEIIPDTLPINPILEAERVDGILYVRLLNFIGADATEEERFPVWQEV